MRATVAIGTLSLLTALGPVATRVAAEAFQDEDRAEQDRQERREQEAQRREEENQRREEENERKNEEAEREQAAYDRGTDALDESDWDDALSAFGDVIRIKGKRTDAALYWKAYALSRSGRRADALTSLGELRRAFPQSRWLDEAKALEAEIRQASGQPVVPGNGSSSGASAADDDIRLMALNGLMNSDAERAVPMIEKLLQGTASLKVKDRALFVLSQSDSAGARALIGRIARGSQNPHLQSKALKYLGISGDEESRKVLAEVYASSSDVDVKKTILHSFMIAGDEARVLAAAKGEKSPELRRDAIRQLGVMGAQAELWELYRVEPSVELKKDMIQALFVGDASDKLLELARSESVLELRRTAIRNLGLLSDTGPALLSLYAKESSRELKQDVLHALFVQGNAKALVDLARAEKDPELRKRIVEHLSHMDEKESTEFLLEILNK